MVLEKMISWGHWKLYHKNLDNIISSAPPGEVSSETCKGRRFWFYNCLTQICILIIFSFVLKETVLRKLKKEKSHR